MKKLTALLSTTALTFIVTLFPGVVVSNLYSSITSSNSLKGLLTEDESYNPSGESELIMDTNNDTLILRDSELISPLIYLNESNNFLRPTRESSSSGVFRGGVEIGRIGFNESPAFTDLPEQVTLEEYPMRDPLYIAIPMSCIYSMILIVGLFGNLSTMWVIAKNRYMHNATNYYLFSLAMSDLLLLLTGLPQEIYHIWIKYPYMFGEAFCVTRGLAAESSSNATVLTITAFTVERFVAIVYPLKSQKLSKLSRVVKMIGMIWLMAFCLSLPQAAQFGVQDLTSKSGTILVKGAWCTLVREIFPFAFQISICVFFVFPMTLITVLYIFIGIKLRRSRRGRIGHRSELNTVDQRPQIRSSQTHVIQMLVAVVVAFFICWCPFHIQRLMALYGKSQEQPPSKLFMTVYQGVVHVSGILYYVSTCINPILYHIMSHRFRQAFRDTIIDMCGKPRNPIPARAYSTISHRSSRLHRSCNPHNQTNGGGGHHVGGGGGEIGQTPREVLATVAENSSESHAESVMPMTPSCNCSTPFTATVTRVGLGAGLNGSSTASASLELIPKNGQEHKCVHKNKYLSKRGKNVNRNGLEHHSSDVFRKDETPNTLSNFVSLSPSIEKDLNGIGTISNPPLEDLKDKSQKQLNQEPNKNQVSKQSGGCGGLRSIFFINKEKSEKGKFGSGFTLKGKNKRLSNRPPSDPGINSITILDSNGKSKTVPASSKDKRGIHRPRTGSNGDLVNFIGIHKTASRATSSHTSVNSTNTNTISNSSLQDMDETEYTGMELAEFMGEINDNPRTPRNSYKNKKDNSILLA